VSGTPTTDPELIKWDAIHAEHRERYRLPPDIGARGLDLNAAEVSSDKAFTVREAEMRVIGAAMDWADNDAEDEIEQVAREMGIACCLADLAKAIVDTPVAAVDGQRREGEEEILDYLLGKAMMGVTEDGELCVWLNRSRGNQEEEPAVLVVCAEGSGDDGEVTSEDAPFLTDDQRADLNGTRRGATGFIDDPAAIRAAFLYALPTTPSSGADK